MPFVLRERWHWVNLLHRHRQRAEASVEGVHRARDKGPGPTAPRAGTNRPMSRCTLQKLTLESPVMQRLGSRVEQPFSVSIEAAGLAVFAHRTRFRDPGSLVRT